jgi:hypothetical protein
MTSPVPSEAQNPCARCQTIDFDEIFSIKVPEWAPYNRERVLDLGLAQGLVHGCALCSLFAAMWNTDNNTASCSLNFTRTKDVLLSPWRGRSYQHDRVEGEDTILLFLAPGPSTRGWTHQKGCLSSIQPPRSGPNIGFRMISPATFDFHFVSDSISYCSVSHGSSCKQQLNDAPNFFKVVDCKARQVVVAQPGCQYLALSYVWGSTISTSNRSLLDLDNCPKVINDSIDVTLKLMFLDRNLDTSQPSGTRDPAPPLLRAAQARLNFGSGLLRSAYPSHQKSSTFNEEPEKAPCSSQGSQICSHYILIPRRLLSRSAYLYIWDLFLPSGYYTPSSAFCLGLYIL